MNFVKKWISCIITFATGVCGFALSALVGMSAVAKVDGSALAGTAVGDTSATLYEETTKAFKVLTDGDLYTKSKDLGIGSEFMVMKVFAIITLIISVLLVAYSIVMLLKNLNVIKCSSKWFNIAGVALVGLLLVSVIGLFVASNCYANAMEDAIANLSKTAYSAGFTARLSGLGMDSATITSLLGMHKFSTCAKIGAYQPAMLVISIISALVVSTFAFINRKEA